MNNFERRLNYRQVAPDVYKAMSQLEVLSHHTSLEHALIELVKVRASQINSCAYCLDMHTKDAMAEGETVQRLMGLDAWREAPFYSDRERAALAWTEAVTLIAEKRITDELYQQTLTQLTEKEIAELTLAIITINGWNRLAIAFRTPAGIYQPAAAKT